MTVQMSSVLAINIRPIEQDDEPFIYTTGIKSIVDDSRFLRRKLRKSRRWFSQILHAWLQCAFQDSDSYRILLATSPDDPNHYYGWVLLQDNICWWGYTKPLFRNMGVLTRLLQECGNPETPFHPKQIEGDQTS